MNIHKIQSTTPGQAHLPQRPFPGQTVEQSEPEQPVTLASATASAGPTEDLEMMPGTCEADFNVASALVASSTSQES